MRRRLERLEHERSEVVADVDGPEAGQHTGFRMILAEIVAIGFLTIVAFSLLSSMFGLHTINPNSIASALSL